MKSLETERLILRKFQEDDLEDFYEYAKMETVGPNAGWTPHQNIDFSKEILRSFINGDEVWAICHKTDRKVIGSVGLHKKADDKQEVNYEIGYVLSTPYEKQGLMTEAIKAVLEFIFLDLKLEKVLVAHFLENTKSSRLIQKFPFKFLRNIEYNSRDFGIKTSKLYVMTKQDFLEENDENMESR